MGMCGVRVVKNGGVLRLAEVFEVCVCGWGTWRMVGFLS